MTTYQDPPLHSRRAARQGERAEAENASSSTSDSSTPTPMNSEPLTYATTSRPPLPQYDGHDLRPRRTVESTDHADLPPTEALPSQDAASFRSRDYSPEGRRAMSPAGPPSGGVRSDGVVEFQTQAREAVPTVIPEAPSAHDELPAAAEPVARPVPEHAEHTMTRRELRALREAGLITDVTDLSQPIPLPHLVPPPAAETPAAEAPVVGAPVVEAPVAEAQAAEPPAAEAPVGDVPAPEVPAAVAPIADPIPLVPPALVVPSAQPSSRLDSALAEFDALAAGREPIVLPQDAPAPLTGRRAAAPAQSTAPEASAYVVIPSEPAPAEVVAPEAVAPEADAPEAVAPEADVQPEVVEEPARPVEQEPTAFAAQEPLPPSTEGLSAFDALFQPPSAAIPVVVAMPVDDAAAQHDVIEAELEPEPTPLVDPLLAAPAPQGAPAMVPPPPSAYPVPVDLPAPTASAAPIVTDPAAFPFAPPAAQAPIVDEQAGADVDPGPTVGHWSTQADIDDAEQLNDTTISRSVGAGNGAITTSALVLPSVPDHLIGGPIGDGGEIMLTGSISLPDSLSVTGALPSQLDESDIDHLLDPGDHQVASTDSTPVRAIRAVSTHTASGGIISPTKPKGTRGFTILIIAASAMAVVVVGLLVVGLVSGTL